MIEAHMDGAIDDLLLQVQEYMKGLGIHWAVCGGYALDLFVNGLIRKHSDVDICVFEKDRGKVVASLLRDGWQVYQFLGQGRVLRLEDEGQSTPGRNLMCIKEGCKLVKFCPSGEEGVMLYEFFHTGIERLDYLEFLFNTSQNGNFIFQPELGLIREMEKAILYRGKIPYLAPEVALLYKASAADRMEYQQDFEATAPYLEKGQLTWLHEGLKKLYPQGHPWQNSTGMAHPLKKVLP